MIDSSKNTSGGGTKSTRRTLLASIAAGALTVSLGGLATAAKSIGDGGLARRRLTKPQFIAQADDEFAPATRRVVLGSDIFFHDTWHELHGRRVGLVTNQTGTLSDGTHLVDALQSNPLIKLRALFSPEHGLRGVRTAGSYVASYTDPRTGLPVRSLYGPTREPSAAMLHDIDVLVFNIQDVGARTYTYISTMAMIMRAAAKYKKTVWILDRPNPIGGEIIEGPVLDPKFSSFIGLYPIAMRHGMTVGELAVMYNTTFGINCDLKIVTMENYTRAMLWPDTNLSWIPTSPHMPHFSTTVVYLATGPIGGAGINNGVSTSAPFAYALARELDGRRLAETLNARGIVGARFIPVEMPGTQMSGIRIDVHAPANFRSVDTAVELLTSIHAENPEILHFAASGFDRDWGTDTLRRDLINGADANEIAASWAPRLTHFAVARRKALLYT